MTFKNQIIQIILLTVAFSFCEAQPFRIISYNAENLFDTINDPLTADDDFTPEGNRHWDSFRYWHKLHQLSTVIASAGGWQHAALVALVEIENDTCLRDLCQRSTLRKYRYRYAHYDSPDVRGIDVALLYDPGQINITETRPIAIDFGYPTRPTRDLLYAKGITYTHDTLHIIVCHTPSQLGGKEAREKRITVLGTINTLADSIINDNHAAQIVLMGDFNDSPQNITPYIPALTNLMDTEPQSLMNYENAAHGTYVYQEIWNILDQFFISPALQNRCRARVYNADRLLKDGKPRRTYNYIRYDRNGYSDHLPIILDISVESKKTD